ncbi:lipopolysaccharide biosynthesis protein [Streptomyces polyrhachis]|uniref:Lipopolysaccharide biosynthesis protein n=1 Tax=Streptomyces polyrhachis TaxID=1282885 RepID=A0ABW2GJB9_9ACTN
MAGTGQDVVVQQLDQDEPDLLRDQFRQLLRYRGMLALGVALGLLGGLWTGLVGGESYVASSELSVRQVTLDPFSTGSSQLNRDVMGTERQTAGSNSVADLAQQKLGGGQTEEQLLSGLQVTNPPNTLVLRFTYTSTDPETAAERANGFAQAYLDYRYAQNKKIVDNTAKSYDSQLQPLRDRRDSLLKDIEGGRLAGRALDQALSDKSSLEITMSQISAKKAEVVSIDPTSGRIFRAATAPSEPSGPGLLMVLFLGAAVGLGFGLVIAWVRLIFDPTARSTADVVRALRAPVLGTLPGQRRQGPLLAEGRTAEEYRSMAFRLAYDQRFADRRRLLVVAPRGRNDVPAAVSVNLAASFAEMGHEVLLIEADLRQPTLSARLSTADGVRPGWARTPARGDGGWPTGLQIPIDAGESGAFDLVPGTRVRNAARALTSASATQLIAEADAPGSVVVVVAPPVLSYADAIALTDRVDGVLVVCDPHEVRREDLERIRELIRGAGGTVLGAVLHSFGGAKDEEKSGGSGGNGRKKNGRGRQQDRRTPVSEPYGPPPAPRSGGDDGQGRQPGSRAGGRSASRSSSQ